MLKRKVLSWILMVAFLLTSIPAFAVEEAQSNTSSKIEKMIADFGNSVRVIDKTYNGSIELKNGKYDTSVAYEGKKGSFSWQFGSHDGIVIEIPYDSAYDAYDTINFRYYTEIPGQKITYFINEFNTFNSSADGGSWKGILETGAGWNDASVNLTDVKKYWSVEAPESIYVYFISGWSTNVGTKEEFEGGTKNAIAGETMYIDSIWFDGIDGEKIAADFDIGADVYDFASTYLTRTYLSRGMIDTTKAFDGKTSSLAWTFKDENGLIVKMPFGEECKTGYDSLVIRYHTETPDQTFGIGVNETDHWASQSVNAYMTKTTKTSGGWDEYRFNVSDIMARWDDETSDCLYLNFDCKWFGATAVDKSAFDSTQKHAIIGEKLYIDSIYLEGEEEAVPEPDPEPDPEPEPEVEAAPEFGKTIASFRAGASVMDKGYPTVEGVLTRAITDTTVAYTGKNSSLAWTFKADNGLLIKIPYTEEWAKTGTFNMRYYAEIPNQKVAVFINDYDTFSSGADNGSWTGNATTGEGWQTLRVDLSAIRAKWIAETPDYIYVYLNNTWNATVGTKEEFEAGTKGAISGEKMYIDSVWLEDSTQVKTVVADFDTGVTVVDYTGTTENTKLTSAHINPDVSYEACRSSLEWTIGGNDIIIKVPYDGKWDYFNLKFRFKTEIPGQTIGIAINENHYFASMSSGDTYFTGKFKTTGEWQESNVEIEYIKNKWQNENPEYIYILLDAKWFGTTPVEKDAFDSTQNQAIIGEKVYIDRIWLENKFGVVSFEKNAEGTNAVATFDTHRAEPVVLIAAIYEGDMLADIKTAYSVANSQTLTLEEDLTLQNGQTVKFMLWDSLESLKPYTVAK